MSDEFDLQDTHSDHPSSSFDSSCLPTLLIALIFVIAFAIALGVA